MLRFSLRRIERRRKSINRRYFRPCLEGLEPRELLAFNLTISASATSNVTSTTIIGTTTFSASGAGANVNIADIDAALAGGNNVVVSSGALGTQNGTISTNGITSFDFNNGDGTTLTIRSGTGLGSANGDVALTGLQLSKQGTLIVEANHDVNLGGELDAGTITITAESGDITMPAGGILNASVLNLTAGSEIGTVSQRILTNVGQITTDTSATNGSQFITESNGLNAVNLDAGTGSIIVILTTGAVTDTDAGTDVVAGNIIFNLLDATAREFGSAANPIGTEVDQLHVSSVAGSGSQHIVQSNALSDLQLLAGNGDVSLTVIDSPVVDTDNFVDLGGQAVTVTLQDHFANAFGSELNPIGTSANALTVDTSQSSGSQFTREANGLTALNLRAGAGGRADLTLTAGSLADGDPQEDVSALDARILLEDATHQNVGSSSSPISTFVAFLTVDTSLGGGDQFLSEASSLGALSLTSGDTGTVSLNVIGEIKDFDNSVDIRAGTALVTLTSDFGNSADPIRTNVGSLTVNTSATGSDQFISEADGITGLNLNAGTGAIAFIVSTGAVFDTDAATDIAADSFSIALDDVTARDFGAQNNPIHTDVNSIQVSTGAGDGDQFISQAKDLAGLQLLADHGDVTLTVSSGAVADGDAGTDISATAATVTLSDTTVKTFGASGNRIQTSVDSLAVDTSVGPGAQFITEANGLTALNLNAGLANVNLSLTAGAVLDSDSDLDIVGRNIGVVLGIPAGNDFGSAANAIGVSAATILVQTTGGNGNQFLTIPNDLAGLQLNAGTGNVTLSITSGGVSDTDTGAADITAASASVTISGGGSFGTQANPVNTSVNSLSVNTAAGNGSQFISEADSTTVIELNAGTAAVTLASGTFNLSGNDAIGNMSTLTVNSPSVVNLASDTETIGGLAGSGAVVFNDDGQSFLLVVGDNNTDTVFSGVLAGSGSPADLFVKRGSGTLTFEGNHTFTGTYQVLAGTLLVMGSIVASSNPFFTSSIGAVIGGTGTINRNIVVNSGKLAPGASTGALRTRNLTFTPNSTFDVEITNDSAGQFDQVVVTGTVSMVTTGNGTALNITKLGNVNLQNGDRLVIIDNDGSADAVQGAFQGLPEGANLGSNFLGTGLTAKITYVGGDGNDVALIMSPGSMFPWHNAAKRLDVRGGNTIEPDDTVSAGDALAIINYINSFDAGPIPEDAVIGLPFGFLDVGGGPNGQGDNQVVPGDALEVINAINAGLEGEGEGGIADFGLRNAEWGPQDMNGRGGEGESGGISADLMALLAADAVESSGRRRKA